MGKISPEYINECAKMYSRAVYEKNVALDNCVGLIDGKSLRISRPAETTEQLVICNGFKRKHALKYQVLTTPESLILPAAGPIEKYRHEWTFYVRSGLEEQLSEVLFIAGKQYVIYGDSGYNIRSFMEVQFQGSNLSAVQGAFNQAMSAAIVTVEWLFKDFKLYWTAVDFKRKLLVLESPVGALYAASLLQTNLQASMYPTTIAQYFMCDPSTLEASLHTKIVERKAFVLAPRVPARAGDFQIPQAILRCRGSKESSNWIP